MRRRGWARRSSRADAVPVVLALGLGLLGGVTVARRAGRSERRRRTDHDPLTGLPNRAHLLRRLADALEAAPGGCRLAVALVDLDGFKNVNEALGRRAGDALLQAAARRLVGCLREDDVAARLGGDEFAVLVTDVDGAQADAIARRLVEVLQEPFSVAGHQVAVGAGVGMVHGGCATSADELLRDADIALSVAKRTGPGRVELFEPDMRAAAAHRTRLRQELARAVERGEIEVVYQPIVDLYARRPLLLEALARWRRPGRPAVAPDVFIALAEESGVIDRIGREVLRQACHAARGWRALPGYADVGVAVNVSVHQILAGDLVDRVVEVLAETGLPPTGLALELTETAAIRDTGRVAADFARLQAMGVGIAVDDFGAGYSSLGLLTGLEVDTLKIDRSLLDFDTTRRGSLVMAIAELGHMLGLRVVAEGVETAGHLHTAREACCDAVQGFHLSRPLEADAVAGFLTAWAGLDRLEAVSPA